MARRQELPANWKLYHACSESYGRSDAKYNTAVRLIAEGVDVNAVQTGHHGEWIPCADATSLATSRDDTALLGSCRWANHRAAKLLLESGANDVRALRYILRYGRNKKKTLEVVKLMVSRGFDVNLKTSLFLDMQPRTPLWEAVRSGDLDVVRFLIKNGALDDDIDCPPLAVINPTWTGSKAANMARLLLQHGADADVFDKDGCPLIVLAVKAGNEELAEVLLEHQTPFLPDIDEDDDEVYDEHGHEGDDEDDHGEDEGDHEDDHEDEDEDDLEDEDEDGQEDEDEGGVEDGYEGGEEDENGN